MATSSTTPTVAAMPTVTTVIANSTFPATSLPHSFTDFPQFPISTNHLGNISCSINEKQR